MGGIVVKSKRKRAERMVRDVSSEVSIPKELECAKEELRSSSNPVYSGTIPSSISMGSIHKSSSHISDMSSELESGEITRKTTPYGKPSLESLRRTVSVSPNRPRTSPTTSFTSSPKLVHSVKFETQPNTSMITTTSSQPSDLEMCQSKDVITVSTISSSTHDTDYDDESE